MTSLFRTAKENGISVEYANIPLNLSMSVQDESDSFVVIDYSLIERGAEERVHLAHELGHCIQGAFYNPYALLDIREKHEARADRWAIRELVPKDDLLSAIRNGYVEVWELAEQFGVTCALMKKAAQYYNDTGEVPFYYTENRRLASGGKI